MSRSSGVGPLLEGILPLAGGPLELWWETRGSSQVVAVHSEVLSSCRENSVFPSSCSMGFSVPFELWQGTRCSSQVVKGISVFLSSCNRGVRHSLELMWGTQVFCRIATGELGLLSSWEGGFGVPLQL